LMWSHEQFRLQFDRVANIASAAAARTLRVLVEVIGFILLRSSTCRLPLIRSIFILLLLSSNMYV
jgi:hypothetical protein